MGYSNITCQPFFLHNALLSSFTPRFSPSDLFSSSQVSQLFSFHNAPISTFSSHLFIINSSTIYCTYQPHHIISTSQLPQLFLFTTLHFLTFPPSFSSSPQAPYTVPITLLFLPYLDFSVIFHHSNTDIICFFLF